MLQKIPRRQFLGGIAAFSASTYIVRATSRIEPWSPGCLDIHHISLGRGACAFLILPDGTTLMIDCGEAADGEDVRRFLIDPKPNGSRRTGEWASRYIRRHLERAGLPVRLDYVLLTHLHSDHMGLGWPRFPKSQYGNYRLSGIADVAEAIPVARLIDRNHPTYNYPIPQEDEHVRNYREFARSLAARGGVVERLQVGSSRQIRLMRNPEKYPDFQVRNIAANGEVWTGTGESTKHLFPELAVLRPEQYPTENMCSLAIRLSYGAFDYYSAGDMSCDTNAGNDPWRDVETPAAQAAGPVDVAVADHHGYVDATGPGFVRALRPRAFVINAWDSAHPAMPGLHNMLNRDLYPGDRDIFSTGAKPESLIAIRRMSEMASHDGHVVFRVKPGGGEFQVEITTSQDESDEVVKVFGPWKCR